MAKITYLDKVALNENPDISDINKVKANDMNEIKNVVNGLIVNSYSTDNENTYSCDYMNKLNTYKTTEQRIGTWIDGKPIYRKVFNIGTLPNSTEKKYTTDLNWTTHTVIKIDGCAISSTGAVIPINFANPISTAQMIGCRTTGTNTITVYTGIDRTNLTGYVILEYTKTTD